MDRSRIQKWEVAVPTPGASVSSGDEPCVCQRARACPETNKYVCVCSLTLRVPHTYPPCTSDKPVASTMAPWCQQPNRQVKSVSRWYSGLGPGTRRMGRGQPWLPVIGLPGHAVAEGDVGVAQSLLCTLTRRNCTVMCACCVRDRAVGVVGVVSVVSVASSLVSGDRLCDLIYLIWAETTTRRDLRAHRSRTEWLLARGGICRYVTQPQLDRTPQRHGSRGLRIHTMP